MRDQSTGSEGGRGQRQDVAFLALAVAVLAIAVALFVGVRSLPRTAESAPPPEVAEEVEPEAPAAPDSEAESTRDPFRSARQREAAEAAATRGEPLRLVGIVQGAEPLAVVRRGERSYYVKVGQRAAGYTVMQIGANHALLARGDDRVRLSLHEETGESE